MRAERERRRLERERAELAANAEAVRERCSTLIGFVREFWPILEPGRSFVDGWAIRAVALHLEAVTRGDIQYLLINVPPGMMKSLLVSVFWPAWEWATQSASLGFLTSSFGLDNVLRDNLKMRRLVESEKYRTLFGNRVQPGGKWGERRFENTASGVRAGRSFSKMTGGRGDRVIIDDPHDVDAGESDVQRPAAVKTFREAIPDRLNDMSKSAIVVIMQRLHADDVAGTILKLKLPYVHLNLPMEFEETREESGVKVDARCVTYDRHGRELFRDPRTYDGELLFEERFPRAVVDALKTVKGSYAYSGQYQQRPISREGGLFKRAWFAGKIIPRSAVPAINRRRVRAWDFASSEVAPGKTPDYSATVRGFRDGVDYFVDHVARMQESAGTVQSTALSYAETDPPGTLHRIPQDPGAGKAVAQSYVTAFAGHALKVETTSGRGDKVARATPLSIQAEFGHLYIVNSGPIEDGLDAWIEPFLDELCTFPKASNDDQVDAASDWFNELAIGAANAGEAASAGPRLTVQEVERDSRYRFDEIDDQEPGLGWGSARSAVRRGI